jgi:hypothetical protein
MKYKILLLLFFVSLLCYLPANEAEEKLFNLEEETYHSTELSDFLQKLRTHPLDINTASKKELLRLPWLSEQEINLIISYRNKHKITTAAQLTEIGIDNITVSDISDYIVFSSGQKLNFQNQTRLEFNEAKKNYPSPLKYFQRTKLNYGKLQVGILSQKDEGETDPLDFYSYYLQYRNAGTIQNLVLGKYRIAFGQGLVFAPKLGMSKSSAATSTPIKRFDSIKPYTSSYELWELQGFATELKISPLKLIPFVSINNLNANLDSTSSITSFNESGFNFEDSPKNNVREKVYGSSIQFETSGCMLGAGITQFSFDHKFADGASSDYNAANFYFIINNSSFPIFGETASIDKKYGLILGMKFGENVVRHLLILRYYEKDLTTWHGHAFATQSNFENETGVYYGITIIPTKRNKLNAYFDVWSFPETRYFEKMPTVGSEQFLQWESHFCSQAIRLTLQHKFKEKYIILENAQIRDFERTLLRFDWWQKLSFITFKTRGEFVSEYLPENKIYTTGFLFYEQMKLKSNRIELIGQISVCKSDTSPFKVKHYLYEQNVDGIMQNSVISGDSISSYLLLKYQISVHVELQLKLSDVWQQKDKFRTFAQIICQW